MNIILTIGYIVYVGPENLMQPNQPLAKLIRKREKTNMVDKIGFVVIDECHLVEDWYVFSSTTIVRLGCNLTLSSSTYNCLHTTLGDQSSVQTMHSLKD